MIYWFYKNAVAVPESQKSMITNFDNLGPYTEIADTEWFALLQNKAEYDIIINNQLDNHPMLYTDEELKKEYQRKILRERREVECFPYVNRGELWYEVYVNTEEKKVEFKQWYLDWLAVTETLVAPDKPEWLDNTTPTVA